MIYEFDVIVVTSDLHCLIEGLWTAAYVRTIWYLLLRAAARNIILVIYIISITDLILVVQKQP